MMFGWESDRSKIIRGSRVSLKKKLEGLRLMNEFSDKALTLAQKLTRRKMREGR